MQFLESVKRTILPCAVAKNGPAFPEPASCRSLVAKQLFESDEWRRVVFGNDGMPGRLSRTRRECCGFLQRRKDKNEWLLIDNYTEMQRLSTFNSS